MNNISDEQALEALSKKNTARAQPSTKFCTHTVVYPIEVKRASGESEVEIRNYVTARQFYPERKLEKAADVEKRYSKLNKAFMSELKSRGFPTHFKDPGNILDARPVDLKR